jgi:hypothetical protein
MSATGFEPVTPSVSSKGRHDAGGAVKGVTSSESGACTAACTSEPETDHADPVATIAAALSALSPADRARLAALLMSGVSGVKG